MALADILGLAKQASQGPDAGDITAGVQAGVQLATAKEQIDQQKTKAADMKLELQTKQASAMLNRTKAAMFAQSPAAFESIMKSNEDYANSIGVPYNGEALRSVYKDEALRLAAQKEINVVQNGGVSKNPQAILDYLGQASPDLLSAVQNSAYSNATTQNKFGQETKIESMKANAEIEKAKIMAAAQMGKQEARNLYTSNRLYLKDIKPFEELMTQSDKTKSIIEDIKAGGVTANPNIKADIEDTLSSLSSGKSTVSGSARHELDSYYGKIKSFLNKVEGSADGIIAQDQLNELERDVNAFDQVIKRQHETAFKAFLKRQTGDVRPKMIDAYNEIRSGYGASPFGANAPAAQPPAAAQKPIPATSAEVDDFMKAHNLAPEQRAAAEAALNRAKGVQ